MRKIFRYATGLGSLLALACNGADHGDAPLVDGVGSVAPVGSGKGIRHFRDRDALPPCRASNRGAVYYVEETAEFFFCSDDDYVILDLEGQDGSSCSVFDNGDGTHSIACEDGTSTVVRDGTDGATGPTGPAGADGSDGAPGANGMNGADGATGPAGADGANGADGSDGATGPTGPAGTDGANGMDGAPGATGPAGADGAPGATGPTGPAGMDGAPGSDGMDGLTSLLSTAPAPLSECPAGGVSVSTGLDTNGNGVLDASEVTDVEHVCNGTSDAEATCDGLDIVGDYVVNSPTTLQTLRGVRSISGSLAISLPTASGWRLTPLRCLESVEGNVTFGTDVTDFTGLENLTNVGGTLSISGNGFATGLEGLQGLHTVIGDLFINANPSLQSLQGLRGLNDIGGDLILTNNPALHSLEGLHNLQTIGGSVSVAGNAFYETEGLRGLISIGGNLRLTNDVLDNLEGFRNLRRIDGQLAVQNNRLIYNLTGLRSLESVGSLAIQNNPSMDVTTLASLQRVEASLSVSTTGGTLDMPQLWEVWGNVTFSGNLGLDVHLGALVQVDGSLQLYSNDLQAVDLSALFGVGESFKFYGNSSVTHLELDQLRRAIGSVEIYGNPALEALRVGDGFADSPYVIIQTNHQLQRADLGFVTVDTVARVQQNNALRELHMDSLVTAGSELTIAYNPSLLSVTLPNLQSVNSRFELSNNLVLASVSLPRLQNVGQYLSVFNNAALVDVAVGAVTPFSGPVFVQSNPSLQSVRMDMTSTTSDLIVSNNASLTVFGAPNLRRVDTTLQLTSDAALADVDLGALISVAGALAITGSESLPELLLPGLVQVGSLNLASDAALTDLQAPLLTRLGALYLQNDAALSSLQGLTAIVDVTNAFTIQQNASLPTCEALWLQDNILVTNGGSIGGPITIADNLGTCP